ncbi:MAG TPA: type II CAAX endopeptidase family protein [Acidobacteriaceae bacterium]|nr:type II CAAX endopeptidase family protein [Acidobacteriaceae bacterium]
MVYHHWMHVSSADTAEQRRKGIAPVWHTCFLIAFVVVLAIDGLVVYQPVSPHRPVPFYLIGIGFEWLLFGYIWWGISLREYPLSTLISRGRISWPQRDFVYGIGLWIIWYVVEALVALGLTWVGLAKSASLRIVFPHGPVQITLWVILAVSSGFAEEIAFRGYLLQQFSRWTGSITVGVILQALLFGFGHTYLGLREAVIITVSGLVFGIFAAWLRNIRPLIITHAWADIFGGVLERGIPYK